MPDLSPAQAGLRTGALILAAQLGVGGGAWTVKRVTAGVESTVGVWAGHIKKATKTAFSPSLPGVRVTTEEWHAIGTSAAVGASTLRAGDLLVSVDTPALAFVVQGAILVAGYARYQVERQR